MSKGHVWVSHIPIYQYKLICILSRSKKFVKQHTGMELKRKFGGLTFMGNTGKANIKTVCIIFNPDYLDVRSIAHESFHATLFVMDEIAHDIMEGQEPAAYLHEWIFEFCYSRLLKPDHAGKTPFEIGSESCDMVNKMEGITN